MMLRTPPVRQKRPSPSSSPVAHVKQVRLSTTVVELSRPTPSPSKKPRRPLGTDAGEDEEPFDAHSLPRGSPWGNGQQSMVLEDQRLEGYHIQPYHASMRRSPGSEEESDVEFDWDSLLSSYRCRNLARSDVLTSLDAREKEVAELKALTEKLRVAYSNSEEQKKQLKRRVNALEQSSAAANERELAVLKQRTEESNKTGELIRTHMNRCAELQCSLQDEMRKQGELQAKALTLEARASSAEEGMDKALESAAREVNKLRQELERARVDGSFSLSRAEAELEAEKQRRQVLVAERDRLSTELQQMQDSIAKNLATRLELEHRISDNDKQTSSIRTTRPSEAELVIKQLKKELSQCETEVRDAKKLKTKHVNIELLKERVASEKARADRAEAALSKLADLESKEKELESGLSAWRETAKKLPGVEKFDDVVLRFAELQMELVNATAKLEENKAEFVKSQTSIELAETAKRKAEAETAAAQAEALEAVSNLKRTERKLLLLAKERDGLQAILASYDEEENVIASHQQKSVAGIASLATPEKSKEIRIQQLERALADAHQQTKLLGEDLEKSLQSTTEQRHRAESLSVMLATAEEKYNAVEREAAQLRSEVTVLEAKVGRGESNSSNTKVLHMVVNPEVEAHGHSEVQALRARLDLHERQFDGRREEVPVTERGHDQEKITVLTQRVTALEKREARYKQVFANKISVFREACGLIFGYKVQMNEEHDASTGSSVTLFTLRSIYSSGEEEQIQFQFKAGNLEMIANEYTESPELQRQVHTFLKNFKSIPAFIANLTMELFNKTTLG